MTDQELQLKTVVLRRAAPVRRMSYFPIFEVVQDAPL
jgi:hypothetical protein